MGEAILFGIAQQVLKYLGSTALNEIASSWSFNDQLEKLKNNINTLKDVMLDAEERQADSHAVRGWFERLTAVLYAADDLFDEFVTVAAREQQFGGNKVTREVRTFCSSSDQIALAFKLSRNIKKIRQELDDIVKDGTKYSFVVRPHEEGGVINTSSKRDHTDSFVDEVEIVGRDADKKAVLDLLFPSSSLDDHEVLSVIPIVGIAGMGKTVLAQLIYDDPQVKDCFELDLWVFVSDVFDIKAIIKNIMHEIISEVLELDLDQLKSLLQKELGDKKYLLVLDDVWNVKCEEWLKLRDLLKIGRNGSKILVTTQSKAVAEIMGTCPPHELVGLSEDESWDLFEKMAFKHGQSEQNPQLVKVGKEIVKRCGYVPLAIRMLGRLLYGTEESKWLSVVKDKSLAKIPDKKSDIMSILKISYDHLPSPLKNCFAYCALFPKHYVFNKETLIELWMAEGFIVANEGQSLEEVGEEYFLISLQRGFFRDIERNELGDIDRCPMHDLMQDLALEVSGCKCKVAKFDEQNFDDKILHLSFACPLTYKQEIPINLKLLRTVLLLESSLSSLSIPQYLLQRFRNVRVLDLNHLRLKSLPRSIGKLIHLRYLDLSDTNIKELPDSITDLLNLQTLILHDCWKLGSLPRDMRKLINLRRLDVSSCFRLTHMPSGIEGLTMLTKLPLFIVGHDCSELIFKRNPKLPTSSNAKLSDLKNLNNLRGELEICINCNNENNMLEATEADLSCKHGLTDLRIRIKRDVLLEDEADCDPEATVLEGLKPHSNIRRLEIEDYRGTKLPSWARMNNLCSALPNLVHLSLSGPVSSQELPRLSQLRFLKQLDISCMDSVEYMEDGVCDISSSLFFPSLEELRLHGMENLKGWWKELMKSDNKIEDASYDFRGQLVPIPMQFPKLSTLRLFQCPNLKMLPFCPNVEDLELIKTNECLSLSKMAKMMPSFGFELKLKSLTIDNAEDLTFLPNRCLHQLSFLCINEDNKMESIEKLGEVFKTLSSSLQTLMFSECEKLRSISKGLDHLTALEDLSIDRCEELDITGNEVEDGGMPWIALSASLRSLDLCALSKLAELPSGLQHLSNLRSLKLSVNHELKELPEWISCLTSLISLHLSFCPKLKCLPEALRNLTALNTLNIWECSGLTARCQCPNGSDWPKIQHIPFVDIQEALSD